MNVCVVHTYKTDITPGGIKIIHMPRCANQPTVRAGAPGTFTYISSQPLLFLGGIRSSCSVTHTPSRRRGRAHVFIVAFTNTML